MNPLLIIKFFHSNFKIKLIYFCAMIGIGHWLGQWLVNGNNMNDICHYSIECDSGLTRQIFHYFCDSTRLDSRSGDSWLDSTRALVPVTRDSTRTRPSWLDSGLVPSDSSTALAETGVKLLLYNIEIKESFFKIILVYECFSHWCTLGTSQTLIWTLIWAKV